MRMVTHYNMKQDMLKTTSRLAHVSLPARGPFKSDGSVTGRSLLAPFKSILRCEWRYLPTSRSKMQYCHYKCGWVRQVTTSNSWKFYTVGVHINTAALISNPDVACNGGPPILRSCMSLFRSIYLFDTITPTCSLNHKTKSTF